MISYNKIGKLTLIIHLEKVITVLISTKDENNKKDMMRILVIQPHGICNVLFAYSSEITFLHAQFDFFFLLVVYRLQYKKNIAYVIMLIVRQKNNLFSYKIHTIC